MNRYKVLGVNDDRDFCECCGKKGLKRVVWIEDTESGDIKHFGTHCAVQPVKGFGVDSQVKAEVNRFECEQKGINVASYHRYKRAGGAHVKSGDHSWKVADPELYAKCRAEIVAEVSKHRVPFRK